MHTDKHGRVWLSCSFGDESIEFLAVKSAEVDKKDGIIWYLFLNNADCSYGAEFKSLDAVKEAIENCRFFTYRIR